MPMNGTHYKVYGWRGNPPIMACTFTMAEYKVSRQHCRKNSAIWIVLAKQNRQKHCFLQNFESNIW